MTFAHVKLPPEKRREAILLAVREVFAAKGFHGTTTRELATAAGISEALMLRHFPTKEALYSAALESICARPAGASQVIERLMSLDTSTSSLVLIVYYFFVKLIVLSARFTEESAAPQRLMLQSILGDGEFARMMIRGGPTHVVKKMTDCLEAAVKCGDAVDTGISPTLGAWFSHHLAIMVMLNHFPAQPVIDYGANREKLAEDAAAFALRGLGLTDEALRRHYNPRALSLLIG